MAIFILLLIIAVQTTCGIQWATHYDTMNNDHLMLRQSPVKHSLLKPVLDVSYNPAYLGPSHLRAFIPQEFQSQSPVKPVKPANLVGNFANAPLSSQQCPAPPNECQKSKYRTLDGTCNNLANPTWGAGMQQFARLLPAKYSDGVAAPTVSVTGKELPSPRAVSMVVFGDDDVPDPEFTLANMQWGQIVTHDLSRTSGFRRSRSDRIPCCTADGKLLPKEATHPACFPIHVPKNDPVHSHSGTECLSFVRSRTDRDSNCLTQNSKAEQLTEVTAYFDLSLVYGSNDEELGALRAFQDGRLLVDHRFGKEWPPPNPNASAICDGHEGEPCYMTGDGRANQNPGLTVMHIMLLREHNFLADELKKLNPHWNEEVLFQETRRLNIAQFQHITYWEWLPIFLGEENMARNRMLHNEYNEQVNPSVLNEFSTAAFRYFHSQIEGRLDLISEAHSPVGSLRLSDWFNRPVVLESGNVFNNLARGLVTQSEQLTDINFDKEIKHFFFRNGRPLGQDLRAIDIQRNRDHSLATYNDLREFCGLKRANQWEDYLDLLSPKTLDNLRSLYASHEDVDLTVGGSLEPHVAGTLAGPTFLCILTEQFYRTRVGDRFFYEHSSTDVAFTPEQLAEIRKANVARLFCNNVDHLHAIQHAAFIKASVRNQLVSCNQIPRLNLEPWKEHSQSDRLH